VRATLRIPLPPDLKARLGPTDLNNVVPAQFTADSVVTLHDPGTGEPVPAQFTAYVTNVRRAAKCPRAVLVVICPDPVEGEKCRKGIPTGHPGFDLWPIVIDPLHAPSADGASPWLVIFDACLGVIEMGTEPGARRILNARDLKPTKGQRGQINAATDLAQLDRWFDRALTAGTAAEVFAD
jgi:hypothetical protein